MRVYPKSGKKDDLFDRLRKYWKDNELVVIVGFASQMIATNNFNSVFQIDIDKNDIHFLLAILNYPI